MALNEAGKLRAEQQKLLRDVAELEAKAKKLAASQGRPIEGSGRIDYFLGGQPVKFASYPEWQLMTTSSGSTTTFQIEQPIAGKWGQPAEIKIWHDDGRIEIIRCLVTNFGIYDKQGPKSIEGGIRRRIAENDTIQFSGRAKAWKRGPDGRPVT